MMMFWQNRNIKNVGIAAMTNDAYMTACPLCCCSSYSHTIIVHIRRSWQTTNANMKFEYAAVNAFNATTARIGLESPIVICQKSTHSFAPSNCALSYSSCGNESKKPFNRKIE